MGPVGGMGRGLPGTQAVLNGEMHLGALVGFLLLPGYLYEPVGKLHQLNQLLQAGRAAGERVFEIMDETVEPGWQTTGSTSTIVGDVSYEDVSFNYGGGVQSALSHLTFHAQPGETVALFGATRAGKLKLVN